jgi:hypothetical protein
MMEGFESLRPSGYEWVLAMRERDVWQQAVP